MTPGIADIYRANLSNSGDREGDGDGMQFDHNLHNQSTCSGKIKV